MNIRFFGNIDLNEDYHETEIHLLEKNISLDLNLEEVLGKKDWILEYDEYVSKLSSYKENIEKRLNEDFDDWGVTKEWIDWHIEEFDKSTVEKLVKNLDNNMQLDEKLLTRVNLVRVGIYPGYEDYAIWDFMLDEKISDQILVVITNNRGEILDITWES
ncbi:DUF2004 domain-containing protein [Fusobacterium sp.]|uniref:DUF2004 domain-containing protein n=1 Tax=Fusobacterium sp. TaxID=68766 RepID=UPI002619C849|nr:DUF2004 domain-containing protein [Fusobacterium sp.]